jgi:hypothetical protein
MMSSGELYRPYRNYPLALTFPDLYPLVLGLHFGSFGRYYTVVLQVLTISSGLLAT